MKFLSYASPFISKLNSLANAMLVNLVSVVCCLPIVTIGAAKTALYSVGFRWVNKNEAGAIDFWRAFVKNLRSSILPWLIFLGGFVFLAYDIFLIRHNTFTGSTVALAACFVALVLLFALQAQIFLFHARFSCTLRQLFINAALLTLAHPLRAAFTIILTGLPVVLAVVDLYTAMSLFPVWVLGYYFFESLFCATAMHKVYDRLENRDQEEAVSDGDNDGDAAPEED